MKNAVWYKDSWLMPNSKAKELYDNYRKSNDKADQKKLNDHCKEVDKKYKEYAGLV